MLEWVDAHWCKCYLSYKIATDLPIIKTSLHLHCLFVGDKCTFICNEGPFSGVVRQTVSIRCTLSNATLLRNLTWSTNGKQIVESSLYKIYQEDDQFVLKIHNMSHEHAGDYNCSGVDMIMGTHVYSTVTLSNLVTQPPTNTDNQC